MKVLLVGDACGVHESLHYGLMELGVDSKLLLLSPTSVQPLVTRNIELFYPNKWLRPLFAMGKVLLLDHYDVISFTHRISFIHRPTWLRYFDLSILRKKADVLSYLALGCDELALIKYNDQLKPYKICDGCEKGDNAFFGCIKYARPLHPIAQKKLNEYFDVAMITGPEYKNIESFFSPTHLIPFPYRWDNVEWNPADFKKKAPLIVHSPTRKLFKGSDQVEKAISILKSRNVNFTYKLVTGLPYHEYIQIMKDADIVIDQVWSHMPGMNALAMLAMGKVVFSGNTQLGGQLCPWQKACPVINADPDPCKLADSLEHILNNWSDLKELPLHGLEYVKKIHDPVKVARQYLKCWEAQ